MARLALIALFLGGCAKSLPPENYSITITSHVCNDAGACGTTTEVLPPIHNQPKR